MAASGYNTNLAAEFFVLSCLHRLGLTANLTLGNKKGVDIVVVRPDNAVVLVEVKGLAGMTGWPLDNFKFDQKQANKVVVLVGFRDKIADPAEMPEIYVIPADELKALTYFAPSGRCGIPVRRIQKSGERYRNAWTFLTDGRRTEANPAEIAR